MLTKKKKKIRQGDDREGVPFSRLTDVVTMLLPKQLS